MKSHLSGSNKWSPLLQTALFGLINTGRYSAPPLIGLQLNEMVFPLLVFASSCTVR